MWKCHFLFVFSALLSRITLLAQFASLRLARLRPRVFDLQLSLLEGSSVKNREPAILSHEFLNLNLVHSGAADYRAACRIGGVSTKPQCSCLRRYPIRPLLCKSLVVQSLAMVDYLRVPWPTQTNAHAFARTPALLQSFHVKLPTCIIYSRCSLFRNRWSRPLDSLSAGTKTTQHVGTNECHETNIISPANQGHLVKSY